MLILILGKEPFADKTHFVIVSCLHLVVSSTIPTFEPRIDVGSHLQDIEGWGTLEIIRNNFIGTNPWKGS